MNWNEPEHPRDPATGEWVELYHGTTRDNAEKIKREGLKSQKYGRPDYPVLTEHRKHAEQFTRDPDHPGRSFSMVTVRIPRHKLDEYTLDDPAYGRQYGLHALKKPLPPSMIHKVEHLSASRSHAVFVQQTRVLCRAAGIMP